MDENPERIPGPRKGRPPRLTRSIAGLLRKDFVSELGTGRPLPGERALAERYAVSRATIRGALALLEGERLIQRKHGRSSKVAAVHSLQNQERAGCQIGLSFSQNPGTLSDRARLEMLEGILSARTGLDLLWVNCDWRWWRREAPSAHLDFPTVLGLCLFGRHLPEVRASLDRLGKPTVSLDYDATSEGLDSFCFDNPHAGRSLARRLIRLGHRRTVGIFESPEKIPEKQDQAWQERRSGFLAEWQHQGGETPQELWLQERGTWGGPLEALAPLLSRPASSRPTAIVIPSPAFLEPLRRLAGSLGLQIPRHLSVVGFFDAATPTELSGIGFNGHPLGLAAARQLDRLIRRRRRARRKVELERFKGSYRAGTTHGRAYRWS